MRATPRERLVAVGGAQSWPERYAMHMQTLSTPMCIAHPFCLHPGMLGEEELASLRSLAERLAVQLRRAGRHCRVWQRSWPPSSSRVTVTVLVRLADLFRVCRTKAHTRLWALLLDVLACCCRPRRLLPRRLRSRRLRTRQLRTRRLQAQWIWSQPLLSPSPSHPPFPAPPILLTLMQMTLMQGLVPTQAHGQV